MGKTEDMDALPDVGENLAKALAHYWDSDGNPPEYNVKRVLDLPNDPDPNLQGGLLGAAGVSLEAVAEELDIEGHNTCVVHFEPVGSLPHLTPQSIAAAYRRGIMGKRKR